MFASAMLPPHSIECAPYIHTQPAIPHCRVFPGAEKYGVTLCFVLTVICRKPKLVNDARMLVVILIYLATRLQTYRCPRNRWHRLREGNS